MIHSMNLIWRAIALLTFNVTFFIVQTAGVADDSKAIERRLYVVAPGIRNDLQYGGTGILVFDIDRDHAFVKRIETSASREQKPENIKGVCASAKRKVSGSTPTNLNETQREFLKRSSSIRSR